MQQQIDSFAELNLALVVLASCNSQQYVRGIIHHILQLHFWKSSGHAVYRIHEEYRNYFSEEQGEISLGLLLRTVMRDCDRCSIERLNMYYKLYHPMREIITESGFFADSVPRPHRRVRNKQGISGNVRELTIYFKHLINRISTGRYYIYPTGIEFRTAYPKRDAVTTLHCKRGKVVFRMEEVRKVVNKQLDQLRVDWYDKNFMFWEQWNEWSTDPRPQNKTTRYEVDRDLTCRMCRFLDEVNLGDDSPVVHEKKEKNKDEKEEPELVEDVGHVLDVCVLDGKDVHDAVDDTVARQDGMNEVSELDEASEAPHNSDIANDENSVSP